MAEQQPVKLLVGGSNQSRGAIHNQRTTMIMISKVGIIRDRSGLKAPHLQSGDILAITKL